MATISKNTKVVPYILVIPTPPPSSPSRSTPSPSIPFQEKEDDKWRETSSAGWPPSTCNCLSAFLAGIGIAVLLGVAVAIPLIVILSTSTTDTSSTTVSTTIAGTTLSTVTTTITTSTSTVSQTTTPAGLFCSPSCQSQQTCVQGVCVGIGYLSCTLTWSRSGDGDIVVATPSGKIIYYNNRGPSSSTDQGQLDVDDKVGTGPENVFWSYNTTAPPTGVYYVCFSQYSFIPSGTSYNPINATVNIVGSGNSTLTFKKSFNFYYQDYSICDSNSDNLLGSFSYP